MILRRNGNKSQLAEKIIPHFPDHKIYIELFFGAGGLFFNKPPAKYNFVNDLDNDVFNLFMVVKERRAELFEAMKTTPVHQQLMRHWKKNKEEDPIWKAIRFLFISNFTYLSKGYNLKFTADNTKKIILELIEITFNKLQDVKFLNLDYRDVLKNISFAENSNLCKKTDSFIYADGPYFGTQGWYTHNGNDEQCSIDQMDYLSGSGIRFAMSEFDDPFILDLAKERELNVIPICERRNLKNRRTEILITNYVNQPTLF